MGHIGIKQQETYVWPFLAPVLKRLRCFPACFESLDNFIEIWIKSGFEEKRKGIPVPRCTSKKAALMYYEQLSLLKKNKLLVYFKLYLKVPNTDLKIYVYSNWYHNNIMKVLHSYSQELASYSPIMIAKNLFKNIMKQ